MKTKLVAATLLAAGSMFAQTHFSAGIGFGGPAQNFSQPARAYASNVPPCPGPDYTWVDGYWSQNSGHNTWIAGSWVRQPFKSGYAVTPSHGQPRLDNRFEDSGRQSFDGGFDRDRNQAFDRTPNGVREGNTGREQDNSRGNGFRGR